MALPDTGTSRMIILRRLLDKAKIKYNTCGKEPIITAKSSLLGCVGNVLLDIQIDRGKHLTIDALVVDNLLSNCLTAWKDVIGCVTAVKMRLRTLLHSRRSQADAVGSYAKSMKGVTCAS
jgi:hypothetical protein